MADARQDRPPTGDKGAAKLVIFDFKTQQWSTVFDGEFSDWMASADGKYLYISASRTSDPKALRIQLSNHRVEKVASLNGLRQIIDEYTGTWVGVAPDGSLLMTRDIGTQEVYALTVKWP